MEDYARRGLIVIVEDDDEDYLLAEQVVAGGIWARGHRVPILRIKDGEELLTFLEQRADHGSNGYGLPQLILLDLNLPKLDGFSALKKIRADARLAAIPVIILTASGSPEDREQASDLGAPFIRKNMAPEEFDRTCAGLGQFWLDVVESV